MDEVDVDGTPFSILMERAVKLKSLQIADERKSYDKMPAFYQHSIFPNEEVVKERSKDFNDRLAAAKQMKDEGNIAYKNERFSDALFQYEKALSVFRYMINTNPSWKDQGIKDQFINEISYECKDEREEKELNSLLSSCYNNIALVCYKIKDYTLSITACDWALLVDRECDKSYYLRACSRLAPLSSGADEQDAAIVDLKMAIKLNPKNKEASKLLYVTRAKAKAQKSRDCKQFSGLFDRGEVYNSQDIAVMKQIQRKCTENENITAKERDIVLGHQLVRYYEEMGMVVEKERLEKSLHAEIQHKNSVDFRNPTAKMVEDAKLMRIDLSDPQTIELLEQLKANGGELTKSSYADENTKRIQKCANYFRIVGYVVLLFVLLCLTHSIMRFRLIEFPKS